MILRDYAFTKVTLQADCVAPPPPPPEPPLSPPRNRLVSHTNASHSQASAAFANWKKGLQ